MLIDLRFGLAVCAPLLLSACAFAPGLAVDLGRAEKVAAAPAAAPVDIALRPITAQLIATLQPDTSRAELAARVEELSRQLPPPYVVGPGDVLTVTVWDHPELSLPLQASAQALEAGGRLVREDGTFFFPYAGTLQASGLTTDQLRRELTRRLTRVMPDPQVDVSVLRYASQKVSFNGAFQRAAALPVSSEPLSLPDALGRAGLDLANGDLSAAVLTRDGRRYPLDLDAIAQAGIDMSRVYLRANDQLQVPYNHRSKVYVMGEVLQSRAIPMRSASISLADALAQAGGLSQTSARASAIYVVREAAPAAAGRRAVDVFQLDANAPETLVLADRFPVRSGDMVYVDTARISRWNRFISQLFPSANIIRVSQDISNAQP